MFELSLAAWAGRRWRLQPVCLAWIMLILGCGQGEAPPSIVRPVRAIRIVESKDLEGRPFPGQAAAEEAVDLAFRVAGPLVAFPADQVGKDVAAGELLAKIDPRDFEVQLRDAQASLAKASEELTALETGARPEELERLKAALERAQSIEQVALSEFERLQTLYNKQSIAAVEFERAIARRDQAIAARIDAQEALNIGERGAREEDLRAKAAEIRSLETSVERARDQLEDTRLTAPFAGTIAATYVENHEIVQAEQPVVRLVNTSAIEMSIAVPEQMISLAPLVEEVIVRFDAIPDQEFAGQIKEIGAEASPTTRTFPVTILIPEANNQIRPGMAGTARAIRTGSLPADAGYEIPETAVFTDAEGRRAVWVIDGDVVGAQQVEVLRPGRFGLVVSGMAPGMVIAVAGVHYLEEGQKVRVELNSGKTSNGRSAEESRG